MTTITPQTIDPTTWPTAYPRHRGVWTVKGPNGRWGALDPDTGVLRLVAPENDSKLPALRAALDAGALIGYRVGRRAVVATPHSYVKIVRPKRLDALVSVHRWFDRSFAAADTPTITRHDPGGAAELSTVEGTSLHRLLRSQADEPTLSKPISDIAAALAALHAAPSSSDLPVRAIDDPQRWVDTVARVDPDARPSLAATARRLPSLLQGGSSVTHGDLHDKNVLHRQGRVGLIDLDGVGIGAAEDDVANLAVHLQLRALQGGQASSVGDRLARHLVDSYRSHRRLDRHRFDAATAHTWFRLACIYRFRAGSRRLVPELLERAAGQR